jgi:PII-like signaling protein
MPLPEQPEKGHLLRIFIGETDRHEGRPLYEWIVHRAREHGLAGATVLRGLEGFGARSRIHTAKVLRLSADLPIVIEIVDTREKIEDFLPVIDGAITEGLATLEKVEIRFYRSGRHGDEVGDTPT